MTTLTAAVALAAVNQCTSRLLHFPWSCALAYSGQGAREDHGCLVWTMP